MDHSPLLQALQDMGLDEKAASLYLTLLGKNRLSVAEIARESGIKRATCYEHLELLLTKNLVTRVPVGKRMYYAAQHPRKVLADFKHKLGAFEKQIEELSHLHEVAVNKPKVTFREGKREIRAIYADLFKTIGDTYSIFPAEAFFTSFSEEEFAEFDKENSAHALRSRDLFIADKKLFKKLQTTREQQGFDNKNAKRLPDGFISNVDVLVFSDKVALISLRDLSATVIENKDIAELFKHMHQFMWNAL